MGQKGSLIFVDLSAGKSRLGGTAFAQVYNQLGDSTADLECEHELKNAFAATQQLIKSLLIFKIPILIAIETLLTS